MNFVNFMEPLGGSKRLPWSPLEAPRGYQGSPREPKEAPFGASWGSKLDPKLVQKRIFTKLTCPRDPSELRCLSKCRLGGPRGRFWRPQGSILEGLKLNFQKIFACFSACVPRRMPRTPRTPRTPRARNTSPKCQTPNGGAAVVPPPGGLQLNN